MAISFVVVAWMCCGLLDCVESQRPTSLVHIWASGLVLFQPLTFSIAKPLLQPKAGMYLPCGGCMAVAHPVQLLRHSFWWGGTAPRLRSFTEDEEESGDDKESPSCQRQEFFRGSLEEQPNPWCAEVNNSGIAYTF